MNKHSLRELIDIYISDEISPAEFSKLKAEANCISDEKLKILFEDVWDNYTPVNSYDSEHTWDVLNEINRIIAPKKKKRWPLMKFAASFIIPVIIAIGSYAYFSEKFKAIPIAPPQEYTVLSEKGQKSRLILPDGTHVWLNSDSRLTYSSNFNEDSRSVNLCGEAFFDVAKNESSKFVVNTGKINIVVYGTAFNVCAYGDKNAMEVSLNEGKVCIENAIDNSYITTLSPDQKVLINLGNLSFTVQKSVASDESLWTKNKLKLTNASTEEMFLKMEHWYGVNIHVKNANPKNAYSLTIKTESLSEMLGLINLITPIKYTINGEEVNVTYMN